MLVETLVAVPMPLGPAVALPTSPLEGLDRWLFDGPFSREVVSPEVGAGAALSLLIKACRLVDPEGRCALEGGALEGLEEGGWAPPPEDLGALPEGWSEGLAEGRLGFSGRWEDLLFTVRGRFAGRHDPRVPSLTLALRALYAPLLPEPGPDPDYEAELARTFAPKDAFPRLEAHLRARGEALTAALGEALGREALPTKARILALKGAEELGPALMGFGPEARRCIFALGALYEAHGGAPSSGGIWRRDGGGALWLFRGQDGAGEVLHGA